jgi:hypothetical protein
MSQVDGAGEELLRATSASHPSSMDVLVAKAKYLLNILCIAMQIEALPLE